MQRSTGVLERSGGGQSSLVAPERWHHGPDASLRQTSRLDGVWGGRWHHQGLQHCTLRERIVMDESAVAILSTHYIPRDGTQ